MAKQAFPFEADLDPDKGWPRIRFSFENGWTGSLVLRTRANGMDALIASVAACPTGEWGTGRTELGPTETDPDCAIAWLEALRNRPEAR